MYSSEIEEGSVELGFLTSIYSLVLTNEMFPPLILFFLPYKSEHPLRRHTPPCRVEVQNPQKVHITYRRRTWKQQSASTWNEDEYSSKVEEDEIGDEYYQDLYQDEIEDYDYYVHDDDENDNDNDSMILIPSPISCSSSNHPILHSNETISMASLLSSIHLAPASEIAYFYLQNQIGLNEAAMWKITNEAGSVLGFTVANLEKKIETLRSLLDLSMEDIQIILTKQPTILHLNPTTNISPTIAYLMSSLHVSKDHLRSMIVAYPAILCYSMDNLHSKIQFFLHDLTLTPLETQALLITQPKLLCCAVNTALLPRFQFLHKEVAIPLSDLKYILLKHPRILLYSLQHNLQPKLIHFFILQLQFRSTHLVQLLKSYPFVLDYNLEHHLLPIITFFMKELDFSPMEMRKILMKFPRLLSSSLRKIQYVARLLRYQLGMNAQEMKRIFFQAPQIVSLNVDETLWKKIYFLQDSLGLTRAQQQQQQQQEEEDEGEEASNLVPEDEKQQHQQQKQTEVWVDDKLRKILVGMPTLLLCSIENNLKPKLDFLLDQVDGDVFELRDIVMILPPLLGYSLEKRIRPRIERMAAYGIGPPRLITTAITMKDSSFEYWIKSKSDPGLSNNVELQRRSPKKDSSTSTKPKIGLEKKEKLVPTQKGSSSSQLLLDSEITTEQLIQERRIINWNQ